MRWKRRKIILLLCITTLSPLWPQQSQHLSEELVNDVIWGIAHEGCDVFHGNDMLDAVRLRACYAAHQRTAESATLIRSTSLSEIQKATVNALPRIWDEYQVRESFQWVMTHEDQAQHFRSLLQDNNFQQIRSTYAALQVHNEFARNALSALSDSDIEDIVTDRQSPRERLQSSVKVPVQLRDHIIWLILNGNCTVFEGETLRPPQVLRDCYVTAERLNHNEEALKLIQEAATDLLIQATEQAITTIKKGYDVRESIGWFLLNTGELDRFKRLPGVHHTAEVRFTLDSWAQERANVPHLWNALADSEIAAIVNQQRADILIPPGTAEEALQSVAALLDTRTVEVSDQTTVSSLASSSCSEASIPNLSVSAGYCVSLVSSLLRHQGAQITASGGVAGKKVVELPVLPKLGVPTLVTFRPGLSVETIGSTLQSAGVGYEQPTAASLVEASVGSSLTSSTIHTYGHNGLQWFASFISADKMLSLDLNMTGDSIRVGLIDAGVDTQQPLLKEFFWKTPKVFPKTPWDKGSIGYDYIKKISDPMEDQKPGIESHGTHVAGLVTLRAFASWLQEFKTMPLKDHIKVYCLKIAGISRIFGTEQVGIPDFSLPSNALDDGIKNEIHLFNLSLRGPENSLLRTFIDANSQVALIVSAAGNNTLDLDSTAFSTYNGSFRDEKTHRPLPNVIFVAALTDQGDLESDSNHGKETVEIAAPGNQITSTIHSVPGQSLLGLKSGTSQAAPLVTATAAILLAEHSGASPSRVKERILNTCDHDKTLEQLVKDGCRLNMAKAVIANYDLIETSSGQWKRGQIDKTQLGIVDDKGKSVDSAEVDRMLVSDENGNVRIWMSGGEGQIRGRLSGTKIFIKPRDGETCSSSSAGLCNVDVSDTKDIVLRWGG